MSKAFRTLCLVGLGLMLVIMPMQTSLADDLSDLPKRPHLLLDMKTRQVLSAELENTRWAPASLTKMMSAYTVFRAMELQHLALNSPVRISEYALSQPPSKMGFPIGTILTLDAALKIIMVKSANDVSVALAEAVGGSEENFVSLMNSHARRLGMKDTQFTNPHGLHDPDQYTSAVDMALLALALTEEFPQYSSYFDIPALRIGGRRLRNHNALLRLFDGTTGMKTGYVCASGFNVVVRSQQKGRSLLVVVMGGKSGLERNVKAAQLLTNGFSGVLKPSAEKFPSRATAIWNGDPVDITREICPRKYAALIKPNTRPPEAPTVQDFDGIDTQVLLERENKLPTLGGSVAVPEPRPAFEPVKSAEADTVKPATTNSQTVDDEPIPEDRPPSLKELAAIYLQPRPDLRKDVTVQLAGAVGPNPFGILHTQGDVYKAPIPVPEPRPALDLVQAEE